MQRNWDMIREILTRLEKMPDTDSMLQLSDFPLNQASEYSYNMELLIEAGLVEGQIFKALGGGPTRFFVQRLTWHGHEFLDSIRSDTVWDKTKKTFAAKGTDMTLDLVKSVATDIGLSLIRGATGV